MTTVVVTKNTKHTKKTKNNVLKQQKHSTKKHVVNITSSIIVRWL